MDGDAGSAGIVRFGIFEVDPASGELRKGGRRIKLQDQPYRVLTALLERPGEIVTREQLRQKLWPGDTFVDFDHSLASAIMRLREALGDSADNPRFVETIPRRGYRFIASVEAVAARGSRVSAAPVVESIRSIAVLPLENLSGDPTQEYFADGMTDALTTCLAQIQALRVISRTTMMRYKGTTKSMGEIARDLHVEAIVAGTVVRSGSRIRIDAQLVHAGEDRHLWANSYERDLTDVVALQGEVARDITDRIRVELRPNERALLTSARPVNTSAYEAYLKGRYEWNKRTPDHLERAIAYLYEATERDPGYALAFAGLAQAYAAQAYNSDRPPKEVFPRVKQAAMHALAIDDGVADAHAALGAALDGYDWDSAAAEKELVRAIELRPDNVTAHQFYAGVLSRMGRHNEAIDQSRRAQSSEPLSLIAHSYAGRIRYYARDYDGAIEQCRKALEIEPQFWVAHLFLAKVYLQKKMYDRAVTEAKAAGAVATEPVSVMAYTYAVSGRRRQASQILEELMREADRRYVPPHHIAVINAGLGETDHVFTWLEKACRERDIWLGWLNVEPLFDSLHTDRRFHDLLRRIGVRGGAG